MNISEIWLNSEFDKKRKLQELLFPEGIYIENNRFRTPKINYILSLIRDKNMLNFNDESELAPRVGFEPTTFRLTAERSTIELPRNAKAAMSNYII